MHPRATLAACKAIKPSFERGNKMKANYKIKKLEEFLKSRDIKLTYFEVATLRMAEKRLHRWCELECGDSTNHSSYCIVRDEETNKPFMEVHTNSGKSYKYAIADREKGALNRIEKICRLASLHYFYQTDPRGCALYISSVPMTDSNYSSIGYAVCDYSN